MFTPDIIAFRPTPEDVLGGTGRSAVICETLYKGIYGLRQATWLNYRIAEGVESVVAMTGKRIFAFGVSAGIRQILEERQNKLPSHIALMSRLDELMVLGAIPEKYHPVGTHTGYIFSISQPPVFLNADLPVSGRLIHINPQDLKTTLRGDDAILHDTVLPDFQREPHLVGVTQSGKVVVVAGYVGDDVVYGKKTAYIEAVALDGMQTGNFLSASQELLKQLPAADFISVLVHDLKKNPEGVEKSLETQSCGGYYEKSVFLHRLERLGSLV